jgi:anti-anti-sigma factor
MIHATFAIEPRQQEGRLVLHLSGELDLAAREPLLREGERHAGAAPIVLDFSDACFIDASVVGALFRLARLSRDRGGHLALVDAHAADRSIWRLTGYPEVCPVFVSIQEATAAFLE